jgi:Protein of unknown function (DUF3040)
VPLSEHEQRLLSQMEQQLLADDPRFASAMRGAARRTGAGRRMLIGAVALVVGLLLLVLAVAYKIIPLGIVAFVVMLAGAGYALSAPKKGLRVVNADGTTKPGSTTRPGSTGHRRRPGSSGATNFMQRMEQRWQQRRGDHWS